MRRVALVVMTLVVATIVAAGAASAAASISPEDLAIVAGSGAALDPETGAVRVSVQPGGGVWQSATVSNRGRVRYTVEVHGAGDKADWVRPAFETVLIEPGKTASIDFTVAPPSDAEREDATAQLLVKIVEAPEVTRTLDLIVSVLGPAVVEAPVEEPAVVDTPLAGATAGSAPRAAVPGGRSTAESLVFLAIFAALIALVAWTVVPPVQRFVRARRERAAAIAPPPPQYSAESARDIRKRADAARAKATARRTTPRAIQFVDPLDLAVTEALVDATPTRKDRVRRKSLDLDALNRSLNA